MFIYEHQIWKGQVYCRREARKSITYPAEVIHRLCKDHAQIGTDGPQLLHGSLVTTNGKNVIMRATLHQYQERKRMLKPNHIDVYEENKFEVVMHPRVYACRMVFVKICVQLYFVGVGP